MNHKDFFLFLNSRTEQGGIFYIALNFVWYNFAFIARESELFRNLSEVALDVVNGYIYARKNFIAFNVFLHFSGLLDRARWGERPRIIEEKFAIFNPHRCCNEIFHSFFLLVHRRRKDQPSVAANQDTAVKRNTAQILKFQFFFKCMCIATIWYFLLRNFF